MLVFGGVKAFKTWSIYDLLMQVSKCACASQICLLQCSAAFSYYVISIHIIYDFSRIVMIEEWESKVPRTSSYNSYSYHHCPNTMCLLYVFVVFCWMPGGIREIEIILPLCGPWLFSLEAFKLLQGGGWFQIIFWMFIPKNWGRLDEPNPFWLFLPYFCKRGWLVKNLGYGPLPVTVESEG